MADLVQEFMSITSCNETEATFWLDSANMALQDAIQMFYDQQQSSSLPSIQGNYYYYYDRHHHYYYY